MVNVNHRLGVEVELLQLTDFLKCQAVLLCERLRVQIDLHGMLMFYLVHEMLKEDDLLIYLVSVVIAHHRLVILVHVVGNDAYRFLIVDNR